MSFFLVSRRQWMDHKTTKQTDKQTNRQRERDKETIQRKKQKNEKNQSKKESKVAKHVNAASQSIFFKCNWLKKILTTEK